MENGKALVAAWFSGAGSQLLDSAVSTVLTLVVGILLIKAVLRLRH